MAWGFSMSNSELTTIRARSRHLVPWTSLQSRANKSSRLAQQRRLARPCVAFSEACCRIFCLQAILQADCHVGLQYLGRRIPRQARWRGRTEFTPHKKS